jgi:hypothetical protein
VADLGDLLAKPQAISAVPKPRPEKLKAFLKGWNPCGPGTLNRPQLAGFRRDVPDCARLLRSRSQRRPSALASIASNSPRKALARMACEVRLMALDPSFKPGVYVGPSRNPGSQLREPMPFDSPGLTATPRERICRRRLPARLPQTGPDTGFVPGGQGVAGSNPAVPTSWQGSLIRALRPGRRAFCH